MESSWWVHDGMVEYIHRHRSGAVARFSLLLCSLFHSFLLGVPVSRAGTPNFTIKQAIGGFPW